MQKKTKKTVEVLLTGTKHLKKRPIIPAARPEEMLLSQLSPDGQTVAALFNLLCTTSLFPAISFPECVTTSTPGFVLFQVAGLVGKAIASIVPPDVTKVSLPNYFGQFTALVLTIGAAGVE